MRQEAWRAYLEMALGLTEASRKKATKAVQRALGKGGATADQFQELAEELLKTSAANREAITKLVRSEMERALSRLGLATAEEIVELAERVRRLEAELVAIREVTAELATAVPAVAVVPVVAAEPFGEDVEARITEPLAPVGEAGSTERLATVAPIGEVAAVVGPAAGAAGAAGGAGAAEAAAPRKKAAKKAARKASAGPAAEPAKKAAAQPVEAERAPAKRAARKAARAESEAPAGPSPDAGTEGAGPGADRPRKAPTKKATANRAPAKKAPPRKAPARKSAGGGDGTGAA